MAITFRDYQSMYGNTINNVGIPGRARKVQSDNIMLNTWWQDIQSQWAYAYDMFHDVGYEHFELNDLHPQDDSNKVAVPIKFIRHASQTYTKDPVTYWLQLQPGQDDIVDYFDEMYRQKYGNFHPVGLYFDILDEEGKYNKWLCVRPANYNQNQFPTFELLRCDYLFQWIHKGKKYECPGILQSQNSYNSGLWLDYKVQSVQDQQKFAVPLNAITETLFYNHRMLIDSALYNPDAEPRAWLISKINRISPDGIARITLAQDTFDQHNDYIERDADGNIIGMWANYFNSNVEPTPVTIDDDSNNYSSITSTITCSGKPQIKIGGSAKTFTVKYYDNVGDEIFNHEIGGWSFAVDGEDVSNTLFNFTVDANKIKVKFLGDDSYIGKILTVTNTSNDVTSSIDIEIIAL